MSVRPADAMSDMTSPAATTHRARPITVRLHPELLSPIRAMAQEHKWSVGQSMRVAIEAGLEQLGWLDDQEVTDARE